MTEPNVRPVDERVDQPRREFVNLLGDRFGLTHEVAATKCEHSRNEDTERRWRERVRQSGRETNVAIRTRTSIEQRGVKPIDRAENAEQNRHQRECFEVLESASHAWND